MLSSGKHLLESMTSGCTHCPMTILRCHSLTGFNPKELVGLTVVPIIFFTKVIKVIKVIRMNMMIRVLFLG
jgi:hypothetical protein